MDSPSKRIIAVICAAWFALSASLALAAVPVERASHVRCEDMRGSLRLDCSEMLGTGCQTCAVVLPSVAPAVAPRVSSKPALPAYQTTTLIGVALVPALPPPR